LLGYIERLFSKDSQIDFVLKEAKREISMLKKGMQGIMSVCKERDRLLKYIFKIKNIYKRENCKRESNLGFHLPRAYKEIS